MIGVMLIGAALAVPLDAPTAVQRAWAHSAELAALDHGLTEARAAVAGADRWANPTLRLGTLRSDRLVSRWAGDGQYRAPLDGVTVALRWKPPHPGVNDARTARAQRRLEQANLRWVNARQAVAEAVREQHATARNLAARVEVARQTVAATEASLALVERRRAAQTATALQHDIISLDLLAARRDLDDLEAQSEQALEALRRAVGLPAGTPITLVQRQPLCTAPPPAAPRLADDAAALAIYAARRDELRAEAALLHAENRLGLDFVQLGFRFAEGDDPLRMSNPTECKGQCDDPAHVGLSLGITLPVLERRGPALREIDAGLARIAAEKRARRRALEETLHQRWDQWRRAHTLYAHHRKVEATAIADAERRLATSVKAGIADPVEVISVRKRIARTRRATLRTALRCERARLAVERQLDQATESQSLASLKLEEFTR